MQRKRRYADEAIRTIRREYTTTTTNELARRYGCTPSMITQIVQGLVYRDVQDDEPTDKPSMDRIDDLHTGDVVQLASGGPTMTVTSISLWDGCTVQWFDRAGDLRSERIATDALRRLS